MPHVVTQSCCADASCVFACPVNCIHPNPDEPEFASAETLFIDPTVCIDCGACVAACPVDAIAPAHRLEPAQLPFIELNATLARRARADAEGTGRERSPMARVLRPPPLKDASTKISVAIVGSGPAGMYVADEALRIPGARVTIFERLAQPYGLARFGVAPDHPHTRGVTELFDQILSDPRCEIRLSTGIGDGRTLSDLRAEFDAVIVATGADADRPLGIPGAELAHVVSGRRFVAWYNGHPDHRSVPDLTGERVVIIGNGNVALDVARILTTPVESLASTDISPDALLTLKMSAIREVVVVGRSSPDRAAFTLSELVGLAQSGVSLACNDPIGLGADTPTGSAKSDLLRKIADGNYFRPGQPTIRFKFRASPVVIDKSRVQFSRIDGTESIGAGLVIAAIGYRGVPITGVPFDDASGTVPNRSARVIRSDGAPEPGLYVTGWLARGPSGFIGTNKTHARTVIDAIREDLDSRAITPRPPRRGRVADVFSAHGH